MPMKVHEFTKLHVRLPPDVHAWLTEQSKRNMSSINSEIVRAIRNEMDRADRRVSPREEGDA